MAEVQTPTGQTIFVPDDWSNFMQPPTPQASVPEYPMPGAPNVPSLPQLPPAPAPPPPPKTIGPGMPPVEETAGPTPQATPIPSVVDQMNAPAPGPAPLTEVPATLPTDAQLKKQSALQAKADAAQAKADASRQAFLQSAEGQIQSAGQQQQQSVENRAQIADKQGDLEAAQLANIAAIKQQGIQDADKIRAEAEAARLEADKQRAIKVDEVNKLVDANKNFKIDDNRRWNNLSTGRKILAGISVALSGLGDALMRKSGPNAALGIIHDAIQEDVNAQMRERENLGKQLGFARNSLDDYIRATGEKQHAIALKMAEEKERVADQVDATSAMYASPMAKLRGQAISEQLRGEAAAIKERVGAGIFDRDQKRQEAARQQQQVNIAGGHLALATRAQKFNEEMQKAELLLKTQAQIDAEAKAAKAADANGIGGDVKTVVGKDGKPTTTVDILRNADGSVFTTDKEEKSKLIAERTGVQGLYDTLGQIAEWRKKYGGTNAKTSPAAQAEYDRLTSKAIIAYATAKHISLADKQSQEFARDAILGADPSAYNISDVDERVRKTLIEETNQYHAHLQGAGYTGKLPTFVDVNSAKPATPSASETQFKAYLKGELDNAGQTATLQTLGAQAQSTDPSVSGPALERLRIVAKQGPTEVDRRSAETWIKGFEGKGPSPSPSGEAYPPRQVSPGTPLPQSPTVLQAYGPSRVEVLYPDGTVKTMTMPDALVETRKTK